MDGYALSGIRNDGIYRLVGAIPAGGEALPSLRLGECVRILTGAPLPFGADRIVIQEDVEIREASIFVRHQPALGSHIRRRGEDGVQGEVLIPQGTLLDAVHVGLAASAGYCALRATRRPRVWILGTGHELVEPGHPLKFGQIYNSNSAQLETQITSWGGDPVRTEILDDRPELITEGILRALRSGADMICVSGGASVGDADFSSRALRNCGFTIRFHGVNLKPGKPLLFATRGTTLAFGIPGNPVSHLAIFALFVAPALQMLKGLPMPSFQTACLSSPWTGRKDRRDRWLPSKVSSFGGKTELHILPWKGSGDLPGCRGAQAVACLPFDATELPAGSKIAYALF